MSNSPSVDRWLRLQQEENLGFPYVPCLWVAQQWHWQWLPALRLLSSMSTTARSNVKLKPAGLLFRQTELRRLRTKSRNRVKKQKTQQKHSTLQGHRRCHLCNMRRDKKPGKWLLREEEDDDFRREREIRKDQIRILIEKNIWAVLFRKQYILRLERNEIC